MDTPLLALTRKKGHPLGGRSPETIAAENMRQLVQLRWMAVGGQLATILLVHFGLGVDLPLLAMLCVVAVLAIVNLGAMMLLGRHRITNLELLVALLFDVATLSLQLYFSGGSTNPFISLFLLQVVLGAILLNVWSVWVLVAVTCLCFALLSVFRLPLAYPQNLLPEAADLYNIGNWLSFVLVAVLLVLFVTRISRNLRLRDTYLADMRQRAAEEDNIVRMGLFASGAAHELGTPLASLSVILGDWRRMPLLAGNPELLGEVEEMQEEVQRCKAIVSDILHSAGQPRGEELASTALNTFLESVADAWKHAHPATLLDIELSGTERAAIIADPALRQAIWNLLDNAAEVSPSWVKLRAVRSEQDIVLAVSDRGLGFDPTALRDFGKPHQSRKGPGHGVGLFLVSNVMRRLGGRAEVSNLDGGGAEVRLYLPLAPDQHWRA